MSGGAFSEICHVHSKTGLGGLLLNDEEPAIGIVRRFTLGFSFREIETEERDVGL